MLKYKISKSQFEELDENVRGLYSESGEDEFTLAVEGIDDPKELKRAKDHEKTARKEAEKKLAETKEQLDSMQSQLDGLKEGQHKKSGDVEALEKSYQEKISKLQKDAKEQTDRLTSIIKERTVEATAQEIASELAGENSHLLLPHVRARLGFELDDQGAHVRVLDEDGSPSADSVEDLKNSYFTSERYAPIVIGTKASGGGASGGKKGGGAPKKLSEMNATEEALFAKQNPEKYKQMVESEGASV